MFSSPPSPPRTRVEARRGGPFPRFVWHRRVHAMHHGTKQHEAHETDATQRRNAAPRAHVVVPRCVCAISARDTNARQRRDDATLDGLAGGTQTRVRERASASASAGVERVTLRGWGTAQVTRGGDAKAVSWGLGRSSLEGGDARIPGPWGLARFLAPSGVGSARAAAFPPWGVPRFAATRRSPGL